jgi:hypothetical protein
VRLVRAANPETYVPGHGPIADAEALDRYIDLLDHVEAAAREALAAGQTAEEAGARYRLPGAVEDWHLFSPSYFEVAIGAWLDELGGRR